MAIPVNGDDNGIGYGVLGTSVPAIGVKGLGGPAASGRVKVAVPPPAGVHGHHSQGGYGVFGQSIGGVGVYGTNSNGGTACVQGEDHSAGIGVEGSSVSGTGVSGASKNGAGVTGTSQKATGVAGASPTGHGVDGTSASGIGVWGVSNNPGLGSIWGDSEINNGAGVVGNSVNGVGIWGQSSTVAINLAGGESYNNVGVFGLADRGNGVLGVAEIGNAIAGLGGAGGLAGFFNGDVHVTGTISKGASNFRIDHPIEPAHKYLTHAAVESDEMKNLYDGTVTLNRKGEAEVRLPRWFSAANRDLCYQLTAIGGAAPDLHVAAPLRDGKFRIAGGAAKLRVCWQITGVRNDPWAKANPLVVEAPKARHDRGKYVHPELYGKKKEEAIGWIPPPKRRVAEHPAQPRPPRKRTSR